MKGNCLWLEPGQSNENSVYTPILQYAKTSKIRHSAPKDVDLWYEKCRSSCKIIHFMLDSIIS